MSTYSPNLRIELIGTGDQAGTWGTTTNGNFAYVFESAIAGYQTVSVTSANQALTYNNGPVATPALNQSVYAMLRLTTTTGAAFNIYAPPVSKQYIIWNNSGYAATIYNSSSIGVTTAAGIGVTVANGSRVMVWSNGTDFYELQASSLTSTLAISSGGTGQTTANAAFNALAPSQTGNNGRYLKSDGTNTSWDAIDISTSDISGVLLGVNGGTGVNNSGKTITLGGNLTTSGAFNTTLTATNTTSLTLPTTGTLATLAGSETLTNKTISGATNTLSNIANASLTNSSITVNSTAISLGGSATITAVNPNALTIGTGLSGTSYNGGSAVTIAIDSTVATLTGIQTLTNKTLTSPTLTSPTLTTPALGTPSSGALTNCTSLPIDGGTTGTLPVARGGTGVTTSTGSGSVVLSASPTFTGSPSLPTSTAGVTQSFGNNSTALATTAFVQAAIQALHPVGSIYINATNGTNPATLLGFGTWTAFGAGRVPVGFDSGNALFDTAEETGGSADAIVVSHTHTATVIDPQHSHTTTGYSDVLIDAFSGTNGRYAQPKTSGTNTTSDAASTRIEVSNSTTGSSGTNANYQPYITVYMWKRTA